jgi:hypothetical protein
MEELKENEQAENPTADWQIDWENPALSFDQIQEINGIN